VRPRALVAASATTTVVVAAGVLWLTGGLRAADTPATVRAGQEVDQHLFRTRLVGAHVTTVPKTKFAAARRLLVINAWVVNPTRETTGTMAGADDDVFAHGIFLYWNTRNGPRPTLKDAQGIAGDTLFRSLQPRLPTYVAVQYELSATTMVPDHIKVALAAYRRTAAGVLDPRGYWGYQPRRYTTRVERDPFTHRSGRVTRIIPVLVANVTLPVKR
jgi:hypothetical protein